MKNYFILITSLGLLLFTNCSSDDPPKKMSSAELTDAIGTLLNNSPIPGFAITIVRDDQIAYQKAFGNADVSSGRKYENNTTQPIGSISKTFIAAALMKAIEQGHLTMEDNINDLLPFDIINPHSPNIPIKVKHLTIHSSGLIDKEETYASTYYMLRGESSDLTTTMQSVIGIVGIEEGDGISLAAFMKAYYSPDGALYSEDNFGDYEAGTTWEYSNVATSLAAYIVEVSTGIKYSEYVSQHILNPLGMSSSAYQHSEIDNSRAASLYYTINDPWPRYSSFSYPDGFLNTSNEDIGKYIIEMIRGADGGGSILSQESYKVLFTKNNVRNDQDLGHGVFWEVNTSNISHDGGDPGLVTLLSLDPISKTGRFVMTNIDTDSDDGDEIGRILMEINALAKEFQLGQ